MVQAVIFDWGRTLYDTENACLFPDTRPVLEYLRPRYKLGLVSLVHEGTIEERIELLQAEELEHYFAEKLYTTFDKEGSYRLMVTERLRLPHSDVAIVDDRIIPGIKWGNQRGCMTIWVKRGKFSHEVPTAETGPPTHIISTLAELLHLL
jgi:FMN phosphatase YigB (HAD superfamily)